MEIPSFGWTRMASTFGATGPVGGRLNSTCGTERKCTEIVVRRSGRRLPVRKKNGTPDHRQLSTNALKATNVSVVESGRYVLQFAIAGHGLAVDRPGGVLASHDLSGRAARRDRPKRLENLDLLVADRVGIQADRRLHRHHAQQVHHVVLHDVANRAGPVVVSAPALGAERLGHRDLHVVEVFLVPDRLENAVGEPQDHEVLDGFLAEVVVDAEDLPLGDALANLGVEHAGAVEVRAERLFDDDPRPRPGVLAPGLSLALRARPDSFSDRTIGTNVAGGVAR